MNSITPFTPAEIISLHQGQPVTTSLKVAELFGKQHKDVLRKIEQLDCPSEFASAHFCAHVENQKVGVTRRDMKHYEMTKDGFMLLVMGFTGKQAMATKIAFINAFNWMAEQLAAQRTQPAIALSYDELQDLAWCWRAADKMLHLAQSIENLLYAAEHREAPNCYSIVREYPNTLAKAKAVLINHTRDLPLALYADDDSNWSRVLRPLHNQPRQIGHNLRLR
ncbi:Rha family transcriptional regulator [Aeromonas sp. sif2433]|uniref:Rha family transcriptional regulator n=1 Tax=Aeromonas sp. sif2433 TaxID=2854794 RepID=UPI001C47581A|nr:Rha family transcriptional regulator [Aeromonas sp. sif2433]MBV7413625.1 Rha family transcriptional regulator [Aeromonas sp. sif2433]